MQIGNLCLPNVAFQPLKKRLVPTHGWQLSVQPSQDLRIGWLQPTLNAQLASLNKVRQHKKSKMNLSDTYSV